MVSKFTFPKLRLCCRRERRVLTTQGWLLSLALVATLLWGMVTHLYGFFAIQAPLSSAQALVVEGWLLDDRLDDVIQEFRRHPYQLIITTGGAVSRGYYLSPYKNFAIIAQAGLLQKGLDPKQVIAVDAPEVARDRTYNAGLALHSWLAENHPDWHQFNLITTGVHARRSQFLFQKALGPDVQVGVLSMPDSSYNPDRWWASSEGVKMVFFELLGYVYAGIFNSVE
jgi:hypothetical protein